MRVLLVHHSILPDGFVPMGLSVLSAILKKQFHNVELFDTFHYDHKDKIKTLSPLFKSKKYKPKEDVFVAFKDKLRTFKPDLVGFTATTNEMSMIKRLMRLIKNSYIVLGGAYPTTVPEEAIKIKGVNAICIGEGEEAISELAIFLENDIEPKHIRNLWIKYKGRVVKNTLRPLIDINELPYMDYDIVKKEMLIKPFKGKDYISGQIEQTRGCPYKCAYCINSYLHGLYKGLGQFYRRKTSEKIVEEIEFLKSKHNLEFLRFGDENFLGQPIVELEKFAELYKKINLPFVIATRPETITEEKLKILKTMPIEQVSLGIEHGNEEFRKRVLQRNCTNESILKAYKLLREYKIRSGAYLMIGFPTETEKLIREGFDLVLECKPDIVAVYFFRPYENTPLMDMCKKLNLLKKGSANYFEDSIVKGISQKRLTKLRDDFYEEFKSASDNPC